ncbi:hypothetical protein OH146_02700 [Salinibacterium sp. SYSU T00001]|uniref:hypothetical protein n=1 Tax=Homoserinimonas sedimenticola TaxID=2986805 RepID=UPI0022357BAA|nr:hypothetical protein [Salinibacterium sedimenticola]MCW4384679.1 hypothetical protein [Salinibacterium sedimenticola]
MTQRQSAALRGCLVALFATHVAAFSHVTGGGGEPQSVALILALAFSVPLCIGLFRARVSRLTLAVSIAATQAVYHTLFAVFGTADATATVSFVPAAGHHHHAAVPVPTGAGSGPELSIAPTPEMVVAHVVAAILTFGFVLVLRDALARSLSRTVVSSVMSALARLRYAVGVAMRLLADPPAAFARLRLALSPVDPPVRPGARPVLSGFLQHCGPPAASYV